MIKPALIPLVLWRNADFRTSFNFTGFAPGEDLTSFGNKRLQIRTTPGATDTPHLDINDSVATANGSVLAVLSGTSLEVFFAKEDLEAIPNTVAAPRPCELFYDVSLIEPDPGADQVIYIHGPLTLNYGVTR